MSSEEGLFKYGFLTVFVTMGIIFLITRDFPMTANAGCAGTLMVMIAMVSLRYKTKEYIGKHPVINIFLYALLGLCAGLIVASLFTPAAALSVDVNQDGRYTTLNITGVPPFDIYSDEGDNRYTWSNIVVLDFLDEGRTNTLVIIDGTNETITTSVDVPVITVDIFISIVLIVSALLALLGIRYPIFILPAMGLSLIWFAYMGKNPSLDETQTILHSIAAIVPFLAMAYWGVNK